MLNANCKEMILDNDKKVTMRHILNWPREDPDWAPFGSAYEMFKKVKQQESTDELEEWMLEDERERDDRGPSTKGLRRSGTSHTIEPTSITTAMTTANTRRKRRSQQMTTSDQQWKTTTGKT